MCSFFNINSGLELDEQPSNKKDTDNKNVSTNKYNYINLKETNILLEEISKILKETNKLLEKVTSNK